MSIAVIVPSIPPRHYMLARALASVTRQTKPPTSISVAIDLAKQGAPATRQRALELADPSAEWIAPLDDDDEFKPQHLRRLHEHAVNTGADYVYSWFEVVDAAGRHWGDRDPVFPPTHFTNPFDPDNPVETTITILIRQELLREVGYWHLPGREDYTASGASTGEDRNLTLECIRRGARIEHLAERTWIWHHHRNNTSGRPDRW